MKQALKKEKEKLCGRQGFDRYYAELFKERWAYLKEALLKEGSYTKLFFEGAQEPYFLDTASVCAALCLPVSQATRVLDLCAAPGGKTLVLSANMGLGTILYANERSKLRYNRLCATVKNCLRADVASRIKLSCLEGAAFSHRCGESFDSILLDAPCSSERHVLNDAAYLEKWSPSRIKTLCVNEWALLSSAWPILREGGFLLYATCALSPLENEGMVQRLLKKYGDEASVFSAEELKAVFFDAIAAQSGYFWGKKEELESLMALAEEREFGVQILPDKTGFGPLYFCLIKKKKHL